MHVSTRYRIRNNCSQQFGARLARREAAQLPNLGAIATEMRNLYTSWRVADDMDNGLAVAECGPLLWRSRQDAEAAALAKHGLTPVSYDLMLRRRLGGKAYYLADYASGAY